MTLPRPALLARPTALLTATLLLAAAACERPLPEGVQSAGEWTELLQGNAYQWRGYRKQGLPDGWQFDSASGVLARVGPGGDIVTNVAWDDFELEAEWKVAAGGNSGIFYRATEETDVIYMNATEMQILDNAGHRDGASPLTSTGANYALYAPTEDASKPVGEWNHVRIVAFGARVQHYLNGKLIVEYWMGSPDWQAKVKASKFAQWPAYGRAMRGHIGLQDHGDSVSFRNVRVRELQ
jgi:hypothetical protein